METLVDKAHHFVKELYDQHPYSNHHFDHTLRVLVLCRALAEGADICMETLEVAALFHDSGRCSADHGCHGEKSATIAYQWLLTQKSTVFFIDGVTHAIRAHRFSGGISAETVEAKILQDADRLDALGAVGILRAATHLPLRHFTGKESVEEHMSEKLRSLPDQMHFPAAQKEGRRRLALMEDFLSEFKRESSTGL